MKIQSRQMEVSTTTARKLMVCSLDILRGRPRHTPCSTRSSAPVPSTHYVAQNRCSASSSSPRATDYSTRFCFHIYSALLLYSSAFLSCFTARLYKKKTILLRTFPPLSIAPLSCALLSAKLLFAFFSLTLAATDT